MSAQSRPSEHRLLIRARFTTGPEDTADPKSTTGPENTTGPEDTADPESTAGPESTTDPESTTGTEDNADPKSTDYGSADSGHIYPKTQALKTPAIGTVYNEKAPYI